MEPPKDKFKANKLILDRHSGGRFLNGEQNLSSGALMFVEEESEFLDKESTRFREVDPKS